MSESATPGENSINALPPAITFLGEALAPVAKSLRQAMARPVAPSGHEFLTPDDLARYMATFTQALQHLSPRCEDLMDSVVRDENAGRIEACRAAGRIEQAVFEFVDAYHEVKALHAGPQAVEARELLLGVYSHCIRQICEWLEELVQVVADPAAALERRGIKPATTVTLNIELNLTSPPEMAQLIELTNPPQALPEPEFQRTEVPGPSPSADPGVGFWGTVGALAFGVSVNRAIWGRHDR